MNYLDIVKLQTSLIPEEFFTKKNTYTYIRDGEKIGRNDQCPCGSGKKYKKCCLSKENNNNNNNNN